jgi:hypothetical protein
MTGTGAKYENAVMKNGKTMEIQSAGGNRGRE